MNEKIEIYQSEDGQTQVEVNFEKDTVWLNQKQMAVLFGIESHTITYHLKEIYKTNELEKKATTRKIRAVQSEGNRKVTRNIDFYNLDMIISVGYRVNSIQGTQFRQWATKRLNEYLVKGYTINEKRLAQKQQEVEYLKNRYSNSWLHY